ncbi:hypothetical protein J5J86_13325 [Aquabacter sp. L1I39]|uniref:DUF6165 family protein n=1 Tax=Aquabacter sp. L1I39 TaxID=2820278 RepID=UPI001ADBA15E|nr:DUF6165 family protein [Aquabacter sp. L1I39]QTL01794.1 hypothetical protein J5J86_13325 [Aquabacter sp. L1I39]
MSALPGASPATLEIRAPISAGELIDKITILQIKAERISEGSKLANVERELAELNALRIHHRLDGLDVLTADLRTVNETLWEVEDELRLLEVEQRFDDRFIALARAVYQTNDRRAALKKEINLLVGSAIVEEKSYAGT